MAGVFVSCFDLQFCHNPLCNHNPQSQTTNNQAPTGFQLVLTYNFATAHSVTTTRNLKTLTTKLLLVSKPQNCELKQEPRTLATELHQPLKFHNRENKYFSTFVKLGWNCSEIATSRRIFVLTLNRASALKVSENE